MNLRIALIAPVIALGMGAAVATTTPVKAATACDAVSIGTKNTATGAGSRFVLNNDGTVSATFKVEGDSTCKMAVSLASWQAPDALKGRPYDQQKLFAHMSGTYGVGTYTLTVKLPTCYYQVDLVRGTSPTGPNGSPVYDDALMMGSLHGGTKTCVDTPPTTPPTTPETPQAPVQPQVLAAATPEALPNTGAGSTAAIAAVLAAIAGAGYSYMRRLRKSPVTALK